MTGACPLDCPDTCSWIVTVNAEGTATRLRGNPDHPYTQGGLCPKVVPWLDYASDPSRLLQPLRRTGAKGAGHFEEISWDDALGQIADRFQTDLDRWGGDAIWPFVGTGNLGWIQGSSGPTRLWRRMGAAEHHLSICTVTGRAGIGLTVGHGAWLDPEDFARAGAIVVWGSNTLVANRHLWTFIQQARENGAPLIVVDPIRTRTAQHADVHLAPRPGSDGALALGLCRAIVDLGGADEQFLTERTQGWPEFRASLADWDIERTATECGLAVEDIDRVARLLVEHSPLALRIGQGTQRQSNGGQAMRTVTCLAAVTGAFGHPGGGTLYSSTKTPKGYNLDAHHPVDLGQRGRRLVMTNLGRHLLDETDPPVSSLFVWAANPVVSNPDTNRVRAGLSRDDLFTVVVDIHHTETTAYADIVLPSTMQHEQYELNDAYNHCYLNWNEPAVEAPGACLPHTEIWRRLAAAMGYSEPELFADDMTLMAELLDSPDLQDAGVTLETLRRDGFARLPRLEQPDTRAFSTPSGRFEFTSAAAEAAGLGRLPEYRPALEATRPPPGMLALLATASDQHVNSTFAGTERVRSRGEAPPVLLHPRDASERSIADGDRVRVHNERGDFTAMVVVSSDARPGVIASSKGWWNHGINNTVAEREADLDQGPVFHDNAVYVTVIDA